MSAPFNESYTADVISKITARLRAPVAIFAACATGFAAFCVAFCLLAAYELLNVYACGAFNIVATVCFMWYAYLFFTQLSVRARRDYGVVKRLENAEPTVAATEFVGVSETNGETTYAFDGMPPLLCARELTLTVGARYELKTVGGSITAYREVSDDRRG